MKIYLRLISHLKPYWTYMTGGIVCMLLLAAANVFIIPLVRDLTTVISNKDFAHLNLIAVEAVLLYVFRGLFMYGQIWLITFAGQRVIVDLRIKIFEHLQMLSLDFFSRWRTGEVMSRSMNDLQILSDMVASAFTQILPQAITLIAVIIYLFVLSWKLAFLTLIITPIFFIMIARFSAKMREASRNTQMKVADIASILQEALAGIRIIKAFTLEKEQTKKFSQECNHNFWLTMREVQIDALQQPLVGILQVAAMVMVVWFGAVEVINGELSNANLVAFFTGIALLIDPIATLSKTNIALQRAVTAGTRIFEVIDTPITVEEKKDAIELPPAAGRVTLEKASFRYEKQADWALKDIDVNVSPGEIVALVGHSGAGKTTFINLLLRFYDATSGKILVDGHDIKDVSLNSLRKQIGVVPQETILFSGTIKDNIAQGDLQAPDEKIVEAAKLANAHDFIEELSDKYNTQVGEKGMKLSGGQRQRIAIARAILRDPKILILDEATSSLDSESEKKIQDAMGRLMQGRTTFIIAHRLSTILYANRILVFEKGSIVEEGKHEELLKENGIYNKLYKLQFKGE